MEYSTIIERLLVSLLIGGVLGYEREFKNSPAGFRTHILVCLGATIVALIGEYNTIRALELATTQGAAVKVDLGRLEAQVISGVGFLGAGAILREKGSVKGLTTAATLWAVACLGLAVGEGLFALALTGAVIVFITLSVFKKADNAISKRHKKEIEDENDISM